MKVYIFFHSESWVAADSSEMMVPIYQITLHHTPENHSLNIHHSQHCSVLPHCLVKLLANTAITYYTTEGCSSFMMTAPLSLCNTLWNITIQTPDPLKA